MMNFSEEVSKQIEEGIKIIRRGGVIAFPTDTVYGVGAGAYIEEAIERVYQVKNRPREMALPLLLADVSQLHEVASYVSPSAWKLIKAFLPGGLTLIVYRSRIIKDIITAGGDTVAVRIPDHPVPIALIKGSGMPLVGTSANLSGQPALFTYEDVKNQIGDRVDYIVEGGPPPKGKESTVVDVTGEIPVILRQGAIPREELEKIVEIA